MAGPPMYPLSTLTLLLSLPVWAGDPLLPVPEGSTSAMGQPGELVIAPLGMRMRVIPAGTFMMGCTPGQGVCPPNEMPAHEVTLSRGFLMGESEVTQRQWRDVMGNNPSFNKECGESCPIEVVTWADAVAYSTFLSAREGFEPCYRRESQDSDWIEVATCTGYRLPTEAEWEYAARAGTDTRFAGGDAVDAVGWTQGSVIKKVHPVGTKQANAWGLTDMTGNVAEWMHDGLRDYDDQAVTDPVGDTKGLYRTIRGGSTLSKPRNARLSYRDGDLVSYRSNLVGFRLVRILPEEASH